MSQKKKDKRLAHATRVWEREQVQAALAAEQIDKSIAAVEQYKNELTDTQMLEIREQVKAQRSVIEQFLLKARNKYANKLDEINLEAVILDRSAERDKAVIVNLEDL